MLLASAKVSVRVPFSSDELLSWHRDAQGRFYLRYDWDKPAVVYSLSMADGQKLAPGRELMVIQPEGRSKGKIKTKQE